VRPFLPPETSTLKAAIVARNARRLRRASEQLRPSTWAQREALAALRAASARLRGAQRTEFLFGPDLRSWLSAAEEAIALSHPPASDLDLFDRIARGAHLSEAVPRGRIDRMFRRRVAMLARRLLSRVFAGIPGLVAFLTPPAARFGPFPLDLGPDGEEARLRSEVHLRFPIPSTLRHAEGAGLELVKGGIRVVGTGRPADLKLRETIEGSGIVLTRRVLSSRRGLRPGPAVPGLSHRLGRALDLLRQIWPEAHRETLAHTRVVTPIVAPGTVSFSLPDRPGVSYINVWRKSLVDLADDLLHETAHHRLHGLEELARLDRDDGEARYHSPWRRSPRPLRGILHAAYTFTYRAELLSRMSRTGGPAPRAWTSKELDFEREALRTSLRDLADAERKGLLTPAGAKLRRAIASRALRI